MMRDLGPLPAICPMPVLMVAAYDKEGVPNVMSAAWGTISQMDKVVLMIDKDHKTTQNILERRAFTVSLADKGSIKAADYFGIVSGNKVADKVKRSGVRISKSRKVDAPVVEDFPITMFAIVGRIVNVTADEGIIGEDGKIDVSKTELLVFDQFAWSYNVVGEKVGKVGQFGKDLKRSESP